jgi:hypothetical protein
VAAIGAAALIAVGVFAWRWADDKYDDCDNSTTTVEELDNYWFGDRGDYANPETVTFGEACTDANTQPVPPSEEDGNDGAQTPPATSPRAGGGTGSGTETPEKPNVPDGTAIIEEKPDVVIVSPGSRVEVKEVELVDADGDGIKEAVRVTVVEVTEEAPVGDVATTFTAEQLAYMHELDLSSDWPWEIAHKVNASKDEVAVINQALVVYNSKHQPTLELRGDGRIYQVGTTRMINPLEMPVLNEEVILLAAA